MHSCHHLWLQSHLYFASGTHKSFISLGLAFNFLIGEASARPMHPLRAPVTLDQMHGICVFVLLATEATGVLLLGLLMEAKNKRKNIMTVHLLSVLFIYQKYKL